MSSIVRSDEESPFDGNVADLLGCDFREFEGQIYSSDVAYEVSIRNWDQIETKTEPVIYDEFVDDNDRIETCDKDVLEEYYEGNELENSFSDSGHSKYVQMKDTNQENVPKYKKMVSLVWKYFSKISKTERKCILCQKVFTSKPGMYKHMVNIHGEEGIKNGEKIEENESTILNQSPGPQSKVWSYFERTSKLGAKCKICQKIFDRNNHSTTGLRVHLTGPHKLSPSKLLKHNVVY